MIVDDLERRKMFEKSFEEQVHGLQKLYSCHRRSLPAANSLLQGSKKFYFIDRVSSDLH